MLTLIEAIMISGPVAGSQGRLPVPMITNRDTSAYEKMTRRYMAHYLAGLYRKVKDGEWENSRLGNAKKQKYYIPEVNKFNPNEHIFYNLG